jgi:hypothetical protein
MADDPEEQIRAILDLIAQDEAASDLAVEVWGSSITVIKLGTDLSVTYEKRPDNPHLVLRGSWISQQLTSPAISEFRARAFHAAIAKARELGWIL